MRRWASAALLLSLVFTGACAGILGLRPANSGSAFEHHAHAVAGVHCLKCHDGVEDERGTDDLHLPDTASCARCHESPHDTRTCSTCHGLGHTRREAVRAKATLRFDHGDHVRETKADCVRCHADGASGAAVMRPRMAACLGCHGHDDAFDTRDCNVCHKDLRAEDTRPEDHFVHGGDFVHQHGAPAARSDGMCESCHAERFCVGCHAAGRMPLPMSTLQFDEPRASTLHPAGFLAHHAEASANEAGLCTTCHAPESCADCHRRNGLTGSGERRIAAPPSDEPKSPHPAGWVGAPGTENAHGRATWRDPAGCEGCHGGAGTALCVRCHTVGAGGGNPHEEGRAPGNKAKEPCVQCHVGGR